MDSNSIIGRADGSTSIIIVSSRLEWYELTAIILAAIVITALIIRAIIKHKRRK